MSCGAPGSWDGGSPEGLIGSSEGVDGWVRGEAAEQGSEGRSQVGGMGPSSLAFPHSGAFLPHS